MRKTALSRFPAAYSMALLVLLFGSRLKSFTITDTSGDVLFVVEDEAIVQTHFNITLISKNRDFSSSQLQC